MTRGYRIFLIIFAFISLFVIKLFTASGGGSLGSATTFI